MAKSPGKQFEHSIAKSAEEQGVFHLRLKDVNLPPDIRTRVKLPQNPYDCLMYYKLHLFPVEFKSTKQKSFSFSNSIIKEHQIKNLLKVSKYENVIAGFIFNFREPEDQTYFVDIDSFIAYKDIAENGKEHTYKSKVNKSSIPLGIIKEIGTPLTSVKLKTNYRYYLNQLFDELIHKYETYGNKTSSSPHKVSQRGDTT